MQRINVMLHKKKHTVIYGCMFCCEKSWMTSLLNRLEFVSPLSVKQKGVQKHNARISADVVHSQTKYAEAAKASSPRSLYCFLMAP